MKSEICFGWLGWVNIQGPLWNTFHADSLGGEENLEGSLMQLSVTENKTILKNVWGTKTNTANSD